MKDKSFYVVSGFGDSDELSECWDCELVRTFADLEEASSFSEVHYDKLVHECVRGVNRGWYKSIFVRVLDSGEFSNFKWEGGK
jgi:hypothetical protein